MDKCLRRLLINIPSFYLNQTNSLQTMTSKVVKEIPERSYEDAIRLLNTLQSNAQTRAKIASNRIINISKCLPETIKSMEVIGISKELLDTLNVIHVAGTKGKGTTCAFTESILRHAGLRTGFFSSPHLIEVRERIQIDGRPISSEKFAHYFFKVFNKLSAVKNDFPMPPYFRFLTCMALYVFLHENVDVAIIEVGIGGRHDSTNIVKPIVVGITSLGLEHQSLLGNTLEEIALNKAGIMKEKVPAFTVLNNQQNHIMEVLKNHAVEVKCPFHIVPNLDDYPYLVNLSVDDGNVTRINAALAIELANSFLRQKRPDILLENNMENQIIRQLLPFHKKGLESTVWKGRFQVIKNSESLTYFLDGAHTPESVSIALRWFNKSSHDNSFRVLIFNLTGERIAIEFLKLFQDVNFFNLVIFCPIRRRQASNDNWSALSDGEISICQEHCKLWKSISIKTPGIVLEDVDAATEFLQRLSQNSNYLDFGKKVENIEVLITGSLHLVGNFLSVLDTMAHDKL